MCESCRGAGTVDRDGKTYECECSLWERVGASMPPYILSATFLPQHLAHPLIEQSGRSCFVTGAWADLRAVIKAVIMKNHGKFVRITSDREIRDVYVGSKSRQNSDEDSKAVYNSIEDLMGGGDGKGRPRLGPDLVIVRLNELFYKNKAAPGALEEALVCRLDYGRPTWVLSDLDRPFTTGSHAYSDSVWDLLTTSFLRMSLPRITPRLDPAARPEPGTQSESRSSVGVPRASAASSGGSAPVLDLDPPEQPRARRDEPRRPVRPLPDEDAPAGLGMYGSGLKKPKKFGRED